MQPFTFLQPCELQKPLTVTQLSGVVFTADVLAATFMVDVLEGGEAVSLTGATVTGYAIRADGETVILTGSASGNRASITLDASCYIVQGSLDIVIKVTSGGATVTVGAWRAYVQRSTTDAIVDPGHVIPSLEELLEKIDEMEAGTAAANAAATNANTKAGLANTAAARADAAAGALENMDASASTLTPGSSATAQVSTVSGHYRLSLGIPKGDIGPAPQITQTVTTYQESSSGSTIPSGTWQNAIPNPLTQGMFLWTKTVITYDTGDTLTQYSVSHQGLDGAGSVSSVDGVSPDMSGNVALTANDIPISAQDSTKIAAAIGGKADKVSGAVSGNLAGLDANGNLTDSGSKASDFQTALTFDAAPTQDSTNPVTSGGVYNGLADAQAATGIVQNGLAYIVGDTNTTGAALPIGQFVYVKGHATIAEGLRTVTAAIAANGSITTNNTAACPEGGLNALNSRRPKSGFKNITIPAGGSQSETVLFDTAYPAGTSYSVQITQADQYAYADLYFGSTDRSVNGFKLNGSSNRSASITLQVMWAAIPI